MTLTLAPKEAKIVLTDFLWDEARKNRRSSQWHRLVRSSCFPWLGRRHRQNRWETSEAVVNPLRPLETKGRHISILFVSQRLPQCTRKMSVWPGSSDSERISQDRQPESPVSKSLLEFLTQVGTSELVRLYVRYSHHLVILRMPI